MWRGLPSGVGNEGVGAGHRRGAGAAALDGGSGAGEPRPGHCPLLPEALPPPPPLKAGRSCEGGVGTYFRV